MEKIIKLSLIIALAAGSCKKPENSPGVDQSSAAGKNVDNVMAYSVINNGATWTTTTGATIKAQGGNLLKDGSTYHWFGHDFTGGTNFKAINHYTSTDLVNWTDAGPAFTSSTNSPAVPCAGTAYPFASNKFLGRPFVIRKAANSYVMIVSYQKTGVSARNIYTFLTATSINGPWTFNESLSKTSYPDENGVACSLGDLGAYYDSSTGKAYICFTYDDGFLGTQNVHYGIRKLNTAFTAAIETADALVEFDRTGTQSDAGGGGREALSIFKRGSNYYLTTSGTSGWAGSVVRYRTASALPEPGTAAATWSALRYMNGNPSSTNSFDTQHDQVFGLGNDLFMYVGDRWPAGGGGPSGGGSWPSRNAWFPISWAASTYAGEPAVPTINAPNFSTNGGDWKVDLATGAWLPN